VKNIYTKLLQKVQKFNAVSYGYSRNYIDGGVSRLLPYKICITCERPFSWRKKWI